MLRALFNLVAISVLAAKEASASSYGYFLDSSCSVTEYLSLEDFCINATKCERVSYSANGVKFPGTAYTSTLCAQSDDAIQALFPKGTKLFVSGYYKDNNCTEFKSPTSVYIADNKCHQHGYTFGYRLEVESNGLVALHRYYEHDCSGIDMIGTYDYTSKEKIGICSGGSKKYFLVGTGDTPPTAPKPSAASITDSSASPSSTSSPMSPNAPTPTSGSRLHPGLSAVVALVLWACIGWVWVA